MTKHTPGPWAVHRYKAYIVPLAHEDRPIGGSEDNRLDWSHYAQEICAIHWPDRHRTEEEVRATARLIAAAPDMLALLQELIDIEGPQPGDRQWADKVFAVLAKALGDA